MARMHARKKGKSGSTRPHVTKLPEWVQISAKEVESLIVDMSKEGMSTAVIGLKLRDQYGVPSVKLLTKKSISQVLADNQITPNIPEDLRNLMKKAVRINSHLETNKQDKHNARGLALTEAKIRRLVTYYKAHDVMAADWKYSIATAKLQIE